MKLSKIIFGLSFIFILVVPKTRNYAFSLVQSMVIHSGFADPSDKKEHEKFDYNFTMLDLTGKQVAASEFKGKVIFLNIWATWCGPCRAEMPSIQELYNNVDHDKIVFIMLSADDPYQLGKVKSYIKNHEFTFPVFVAGSSLPQQLRVRSIPSTFVVDKNGIIVKKEIGMRNYATKKIKTFLENLIN